MLWCWRSRYVAIQTACMTISSLTRLCYYMHYYFESVGIQLINQSIRRQFDCMNKDQGDGTNQTEQVPPANFRGELRSLLYCCLRCRYSFTLNIGLMNTHRDTLNTKKLGKVVHCCLKVPHPPNMKSSRTLDMILNPLHAHEQKYFVCGTFIILQQDATCQSCKIYTNYNIHSDAGFNLTGGHPRPEPKDSSKASPEELVC